MHFFSSSKDWPPPCQRCYFLCVASPLLSLATSSSPFATMAPSLPALPSLTVCPSVCPPVCLSAAKPSVLPAAPPTIVWCLPTLPFQLALSYCPPSPFSPLHSAPPHHHPLSLPSCTPCLLQPPVSLPANSLASDRFPRQPPTVPSCDLSPMASWAFPGSSNCVLTFGPAVFFILTVLIYMFFLLLLRMIIPVKFFLTTVKFFHPKKLPHSGAVVLRLMENITCRSTICLKLLTAFQVIQPIKSPI